MKGLQNAVVNMPRRYLITLLTVLVITLLFAGHYSYNNPEDLNFLAKFREAGSHGGASLSKPFPHKIWQIWSEGASTSDKAREYTEAWRTKNPGWRYESIAFDTGGNDDYVRDNFDSSIADVFAEVKSRVMKADYLRYLIMLREGGVWADFDAQPHQPVSNWIPAEFNSTANLVVGTENAHGEGAEAGVVHLCQYTMLSKPGHPAIKALVDQVTENLKQWANVEDVPADAVSETTGQVAFTNSLMDYFYRTTGEEFTGDQLAGLPGAELIDDVLVLPKDSFGWREDDHSHEHGDAAILVEHMIEKK